MNEIVKIHNDLTNEKLGHMNAKELDLFMCICHEMRDKGTEQVIISFDELRKLGNYNKNSNQDLKKELVRANSRLLEFQFIIDIGSKTIQCSLFKKFITDSEEGIVVVEMWKETAYILNHISSNFTRFDLEEFVSLDSKYAKRLYKLLKQYRTQGVYYTSKDDFYRDLDVPKSYTNADFNKRVLNPALKECQKYIPGLVCDVQKKGRGAAVQGYTFTFDKEMPPKKESQSVSGNSSRSNKVSSSGFKKSTNKFNQFQQNDYDFKQLEIELVQN